MERGYPLQIILDNRRRLVDSREHKLQIHDGLEFC